MAKSNHKYQFEIEYDALRDFIEPIDLNLRLSFYDMQEICVNSNWFNTHHKQSTMREILKVIYNDIFSNLPITTSVLRDSRTFLASVTYTPHIDGYDFRINPITFINDIFFKLGLYHSISFINLDTPDGMNYFKDSVRYCLTSIKMVETDPNILAIADELDTKLNYMCSLYSIVLDDDIQDLVTPKNALLFIAYRSLNRYEQTNDKRYTVYSYEYYHHISHMRNTSYPCNLYLLDGHEDEDGEKRHFGDFRIKYKHLLGEDYEIDPSAYLLANKELYLGWELLKPGNVTRHYRDIAQRVRANPNVDYEKWYRLFEMKNNYFNNSGVKSELMGKYGLTGYMGFAYPNEYLVFDKLYNSDRTMTPLTHSEALYALPSDRLPIMQDNKQQILRERELDDRIKKVNHNDTFISRVDPIVHGPNLSTSTVEDEVMKLNRKKIKRSTP